VRHPPAILEIIVSNRCLRSWTLTIATLIAAPTLVSAQAAAPTAGQLQGIPVPAAPETVHRTSDGLTALRATRLDEPLILDGVLDEPIYGTVRPAGGFVQQFPNSGEPATEQTDVWVFFDADHVYVSIRAWDSRPGQIVANEMRRDNSNIFQNDNVVVTLDTFLDRRSAYFFMTNPLGGIRDAMLVSEQTVNFDWNTVWDVRARQDEQGWAVEMAIPFKSLRYPPGSNQVWGMHVMRVVRSKNEQSLLAPVPASFNLPGVRRQTSAATLFGIEAPPPSRNLEFKPYAISTLTTNLPADISNRVKADAGLDARYGLTSSLTLDVTYNTDFAQVEIDEQQVNLTRFGLALPEKRDFFLEGQGVFDFAGAGGSGGAQAAQALTSPVPQLFFSRRIGLEGGAPVPIQGGARIMGRAGPLSMGVLGIRSDHLPERELEATNFSVMRVKGDFMSRSSVGFMLTHRSASVAEGEDNLVVGADANLAFFDNLRISGYLAHTTARANSVDPDPVSYRANVHYDADRYGLQLDRLRVGNAFNPEVGFVRRVDFDRTLAEARFSPRLDSHPHVRRLLWQITGDRYVSTAGVLETQTLGGTFGIEFHTSDDLRFGVSRNREFLAHPFLVAGGLQIPEGSYRFQDVSVRIALGSHRKVSGNMTASHGSFYDGRRTGVTSSGRIEITSQFAIEPRVSADWISLPEGKARVTLLGSRATFTLNPRMYVSGMTQYNSNTGSLESNLRFRWEFQPGSDLFVVYTDGRNSEGPGLAQLVNRGLAIKVSHFLRL